MFTDHFPSPMPAHPTPGRARKVLAAAMASAAIGWMGLAGGCAGPGAATSAGAPASGSNTSPSGPVQVTVTPSSTSLATGASVTLTATVSGTNDTATVWSTSGGTITGTGVTVTYTAPPTAGAQTVTATSAADTTASASARIMVSTASSGSGGESGGMPGFTGLYAAFPSSSLLVSSKTAAVMTANPWMKGARFWVNYENLCSDTAVPGADYNSDHSNLAGFTDPFSTLMVRMVADPSGSWNITSSSAVSNMDSVVAGVVSVAQAAGTSNVMIDPENYSTSYLFGDYNQTGMANPLPNPAGLSRSAMCAQVRAFGKAFGTSLWSRMPNATLYTFFGPTVVLRYSNGGTGIPSSFPDSSYASNVAYNMTPYFFLGLLDACPGTGHIADYSETSYYDFTGLASIQRHSTASQNWVSIFFPGETADIAKSATCWVPLPLIFVNPYFQSSYGTIYPGAYYVTNATDQANYFTRNALYCLQQTPAGYLPGIYVEGYDPWGLTGTVSNLPATWQTCLANAMAVYKGSVSLSSLMDVTALDATLAKDFSGNSAWAAESK